MDKLDLRARYVTLFWELLCAIPHKQQVQSALRNTRGMHARLFRPSRSMMLGICLLIAMAATELAAEAPADFVPILEVSRELKHAISGTFLAPRAAREIAPGELLLIDLQGATGVFTVSAFVVLNSTTGTTNTTTSTNNTTNNTTITTTEVHSTSSIESSNSSPPALALVTRFSARADQLKEPVALDRGAATGNVFVCDPAASRVVMFAPNGTFLRHVGSTGVASRALSVPTDLAAVNGRVYVVDVGRAAVMAFSEITGAFVARFSVAGLTATSLASLAMVRDGTALGRNETLLVVCDSAAAGARSVRVRAYTLSGEQRWSWTAAGYAVSSMVVTGEGLLLALDSRQGIIVTFNASTGLALTTTSAEAGAELNFTGATSMSLSTSGTHVYVCDPVRERLAVVSWALVSRAESFELGMQRLGPSAMAMGLLLPVMVTVVSASLHAGGGTNLTLELVLGGTYLYPTGGGYGFLSQLPNASRCDWVSSWVNANSTQMQSVAGLMLSEGLGLPLGVRARLSSRGGSAVSLLLDYSRHHTLPFDVEYALVIDAANTLQTPCGYSILLGGTRFDSLVPRVVPGSGPLAMPMPLPPVFCGTPSTTLELHSLKTVSSLTHRRCTHLFGSLRLVSLKLSAHQYRAVLGPLRRIMGSLSVQETTGLKAEYFVGLGPGSVTNVPSDAQSHRTPPMQLYNNNNTQELSTSELRRWALIAATGQIVIESKSSCLATEASLSIPQFASRFRIAYQPALAGCSSACSLTLAGPYCTNMQELIVTQCDRDIVVDGPISDDIPARCKTVRSLTITGSIDGFSFLVCVRV
jgi:Tfp pilus assembly major pilin PilA